jgi:hypothetical protein
MANASDKIAIEHIHWDQVSLLAQLGHADPVRVPVKEPKVRQRAAFVSSLKRGGDRSVLGSTEKSSYRSVVMRSSHV